jgi:DNA (cytosine-5)-methyltransferase 1
MIIELNPRFAVIENVRGLLSAPLKHRTHSERGMGFGELTIDELPGGAECVNECVSSVNVCNKDYYDKEKRKEYNKKYYQLKKICKKIRYICICGCNITVGALKNHLKTNKHEKLMNKNNNNYIYNE